MPPKCSFWTLLYQIWCLRKWHSQLVSVVLSDRRYRPLKKRCSIGKTTKRVWIRASPVISYCFWSARFRSKLLVLWSFVLIWWISKIVIPNTVNGLDRFPVKTYFWAQKYWISRFFTDRSIEFTFENRWFHEKSHFSQNKLIYENVFEKWFPHYNDDFILSKSSEEHVFLQKIWFFVHDMCPSWNI